MYPEFVSDTSSQEHSPSKIPRSIVSNDCYGEEEMCEGLIKRWTCQNEQEIINNAKPTFEERTFVEKMAVFA